MLDDDDRSKVKASGLALPITFEECRARFRRACDRADLAWSGELISAKGPFDETLTIDHATIGNPEPRRAMVVLSGVHGVEAPINSAIQCDLIERIAPEHLPPDVGILIVHIVNPWGMAHGRRQNESNVDLNRNWSRSRRDPTPNEAYDKLHAVLCPATPEPPTVEQVFATTKDLARERGGRWLRDGITLGQYSKADGLHFGGDHTEESCTVLERVTVPFAATAERAFILDLHTGHGPRGQMVALCDRPLDSPQERLLRSLFDAVEAVVVDADGRPKTKNGPIARGIANDALAHNGELDITVATLELGTTGDMEQLEATVLEQWAYNFGTADDREQRLIRSNYRRCFTLDDDAWVAVGLDAGRRHLDAAISELSADDK